MMNENYFIYRYKAKVIDVYDGDTITCEVDCGFNIKHTIKVRLAQIDTPEIRGEEREAGLVVRDIVRELILDKEVIIVTDKDRTGKYGRYVATVYIERDKAPKRLVETYEDHLNMDVDLNRWLVDNDYAKIYGS